MHDGDLALLTDAHRLTVTLDPFAPLSTAQRRAAEADLEVLSTAAGAAKADLTVA